MASSSFTMRFPSESWSYPRRTGVRKMPLLKRISMDAFIISLLLWLSSCARVEIKERDISEFGFNVYIFSVSKNTPIGGDIAASCRTYPMQSSTFLANLDTLFVTIKSIFPALQSAIIRIKLSLCFSDVPEIPSSA